MSNTTVVYPIVASLVKAEEIIGARRIWRPVNQKQDLFLKEFFASCREESSSITEIESIASFAVDDINRFLRERGFKIKLNPFQNNERWQEFGVASVLDLLVTWFRPGTETTLTGQNKRVYPAVHQGTAVSSFFQAAHHNFPLVQLKTTTGDLVYITKLARELADFELLSYARQLANSLTPLYNYGGVVFPMVDLKQEVDVKWLIDLQTTNTEDQPVKITQALQETHLAMNQEGARAQSAFAATFAIGAAYMPPKPDLLIDGPFLIWFQRPGLTEPLFAGYITEEDWKKPGTF